MYLPWRGRGRAQAGERTLQLAFAVHRIWGGIFKWRACRNSPLLFPLASEVGVWDRSIPGRGVSGDHMARGQARCLFLPETGRQRCCLGLCWVALLTWAYGSVGRRIATGTRQKPCQRANSMRMQWTGHQRTGAPKDAWSPTGTGNQLNCLCIPKDDFFFKWEKWPWNDVAKCRGVIFLRVL